jgi:tetratricopeptide (TPR) repeat protein
VSILIEMRAARGLLGTGLLIASFGFGQSSLKGSTDLAAHLQAAQTDLDTEKYQAAVTELRAAIAIQPELRGAYYQLGFALFQLREEHDAEKAFTKELTFQPPDPYSLYYLGRINANLGQSDQAIAFYEKAVAAGDVLDTRERLGSAYLAKGRLDEAIRFLQSSVTARPEDGSLHYLLARAYKQKGRTADAKLEFSAAARWKAKIRTDMTSLSALRLSLAQKNQTEAISHMRDLATSNDTDILMASATTLGQAGLHQEASQFLNKAITLNATIPEAHYDLARAYIDLDDRALAEPELEKAVALKPGFYEAELLLGSLLVEDGKAEAAIPHLREAVKVHADNSKLLMILGMQYYQHAYFGDAIEVLKKAVALTPETPDARYLLIDSFYRNFEYERALSLAQDTEARFPDRAMSHYHLGAQLNNLGKFAEAKQQLEIALAKDTSLVEARAMLGDVVFKMGNAQESLPYFRAALAADPNLVDAYSGLGKALIQLKRYPEAVDAMEKAVKIDPNVASLHLYLSQAYRALSRPDDAKKEAAVFSKLNQQRAAARDREGDLKYPN